ncbi:SPX domain-domain-containing protein [Syncephalastrum racemosum]|uniref:SPX domain-domain-containing protein n=1 Tax=Syncephalastrum racemosum TaxID=13706 RepID=A0A1X2HJV1_SYNRA|nr:SPX domain-domain-containing protein [Syncephalastrum racemosum]
MKFAKQLETEAEDIPSEWRPYLIQYKALKKLISKIAAEIERRGLSAALLRECLKQGTDYKTGFRIKYYFTGEPPNVRPCIQFDYPRNESGLPDLLKKLTAHHHDENDTQDIGNNVNARPKLQYQKTENDTDFFTLSSKDLNTPRRKSETTDMMKQLVDLTLNKSNNGHSPPDSDEEEEEEDHDDHHHDDHALTQLQEGEEGEQDNTTHHVSEMKHLVIELEREDEFFYALTTELEQAVELQKSTTHKFEEDVRELEYRMVAVSSPQHESDMYAWRSIFSLYMDAQIFRGKAERDRTMRSVEQSRSQLAWFSQQLSQQKLLNKFKTKASRDAFRQFQALNTELLTLKHYQLLNQTAVTKILKKHDKRSGLTASKSFPTFLRTSKLGDIRLADILCASVLTRLASVIPQPDDYLCPVCLAVAWRPIRLVCGHVFCVRCLIKGQKKHVKDCPLCRHPGAVEQASALNLDIPMQNLLKTYFPKEIKQKKKDNEREQAIEDVQAMTGRKYTEEQLMRMNDSQKCIIM